MGVAKEFLVTGHFYQPARRIDGVDVVPWVNETIFQQSYEPILVSPERLPDGLAFSFYANLRSWMRREHPEAFRKIVRKIWQTPDREWRVMGDPLLHVILPFLRDDDLRLLIGAGKLAFKRDLGFEPKGLWLPETAVSEHVLRVAADFGYQYVALRDFQASERRSGIVDVSLGDGRKMAVLLGDSEWSQSVAFHKWITVNGDQFLDMVRADPHWLTNLIVDGETFGHHMEFRDQFLNYVLSQEVLKRHGLRTLSVAAEMTAGRRRTMGLVENTSWSCDHQLGRWRGTCGCDFPSEKALADKRMFYTRLMEYKEIIKARLRELDKKWVERFAPVLAEMSELFAGNTTVDPIKRMSVSEKEKELLRAMTYVYHGLISCGWFFGGDDRPERAYPAEMIKKVEEILLSS